MAGIIGSLSCQRNSISWLVYILCWTRPVKLTTYRARIMRHPVHMYIFIVLFVYDKTSNICLSENKHTITYYYISLPCKFWRRKSIRKNWQSCLVWLNTMKWLSGERGLRLHQVRRPVSQQELRLRLLIRPGTDESVNFFMKEYFYKRPLLFLLTP